MHDHSRPFERCHRCDAEADAWTEQAHAYHDARRDAAARIANAHAEMWDQVADLHDEGAGIRTEGGDR